MRWDFNPADTNVIAHAVIFSSNVLFYTFFLVLRGTPIHLRPQRAQGSLPLDPRKLKTKAKKSATITITIAIILFSCNAWEDYKDRYRDSIRSVSYTHLTLPTIYSV